MSTRREASSVTERIAQIEEQLRRAQSTVAGTFPTQGAGGEPGPPGPSGVPGPPGPPGSEGEDGALFFSGAGVPSAGLGVDGDLYLRTSNGDLYQKASGAWSVIANLTGPPGSDADTDALEVQLMMVGAI